MVVSDLQRARSRSIAAISVLDQRHFILIARSRTTSGRTRTHNTHARTRTYVFVCTTYHLAASRLSLDKKISETSRKKNAYNTSYTYNARLGLGLGLDGEQNGGECSDAVKTLVDEVRSFLSQYAARLLSV